MAKAAGAVAGAYVYKVSEADLEGFLKLSALYESLNPELKPLMSEMTEPIIKDSMSDLCARQLLLVQTHGYPALSDYGFVLPASILTPEQFSAIIFKVLRGLDLLHKRGILKTSHELSDILISKLEAHTAEVVFTGFQKWAPVRIESENDIDLKRTDSTTAAAALLGFIPTNTFNPKLALLQVLLSSVGTVRSGVDVAEHFKMIADGKAETVALNYLEELNRENPNKYAVLLHHEGAAAIRDLASRGRQAEVGPHIL